MTNQEILEAVVDEKKREVDQSLVRTIRSLYINDWMYHETGWAHKKHGTGYTIEEAAKKEGL